MKTKKLCAAIAAGVLVAGGPIGGLSLASSGSASADQTSAYIDLSAIPASVLNELSSDEVTVSGVLASVPTLLQTLLDPVTDLARSSFNIDPSIAPASISLATVTTKLFGTDAQTDPEAAPEITPAINNALTWIVTFNNVPIPTTDTSDGTDGGTSNATLVEFIDPVTSAFEYAVAY